MDFKVDCTFEKSITQLSCLCQVLIAFLTVIIFFNFVHLRYFLYMITVHLLLFIVNSVYFSL